MIIPSRTRVSAGFSLIEMMVALVISGLLITGVVSLFSNTSNVNRMENGLARLQENGRFSTAMIQQDVRMATGTGGMRKGTGETRDRVDPDLSIWSLVDMAEYSELGLPGAPPGAWYQIPRSYMIRGYECSEADCTPVLNATGSPGDDRYGGGLPAMGTNAGDRVRGADVLTIRYLRNPGVRIDPWSALPGSESGDPIQLEAPLVVGPNRLVVVNDYQAALILSVAELGSTTVLTPTGNISASLAPLLYLKGELRVADFDTDFLTVSYYLRLSEDPNVAGRLVSSLVRRENGRSEELAQGIERLDFLYHTESGAGDVFVYSAKELADAVPGFDCTALDPNDPWTRTLDAAYCPWRGVRSVDVHLLANSVTDAGGHQEPFVYSFLGTGAPNTANVVEVACDPAFGSCPGTAVTELPSGLPPGRMLRREFRTTALLRNNAF